MLDTGFSGFAVDDGSDLLLRTYDCAISLSDSLCYMPFLIDVLSFELITFPALSLFTCFFFPRYPVTELKS